MVNLVDIVTNTNTKSSVDNIPSPIVPIVFFFIITTLYCGISLFVTDSSYALTFKAIYILAVVIGEYFINLAISLQICGVMQWGNTLFITIVPWATIFGILQILILVFPGWLVPFSNTFGYGLIRLMGYPEFMEEKLLNKPPINTGKGDDSKIFNSIESITSDKSLLINELNIDRSGFESAWNNLASGIIIKDEAKRDDTVKDELYGYVKKKFTIAEYIWNLLAGTLVTSVSYNYLINSKCAKSAEEMKQRYDAYEAEQNNKIKTATPGVNYVQS